MGNKRKKVEPLQERQGGASLEHSRMLPPEAKLPGLLAVAAGSSVFLAGITP